MIVDINGKRVGPKIHIGDEMNVPVNIFIADGGESSIGKPARYRLFWEIFMPRKSLVIETDGDEDLYSEDIEELRSVVREQMVPLYEVALRNLNGIVDGSRDKHYYWEE